MQELQILSMDEHPENNQGQQLRGRRGVRMHGWGVQRQNKGIGRRVRTEMHVRWNKGHYCRPCCQSWSYNGWRVQLNIGRSTISSIIQTFWNGLFQSISHIQQCVNVYFWNDIWHTYAECRAHCYIDNMTKHFDYIVCEQWAFHSDGTDMFI